uniref:Uncharacterized protein n=1 Tax=Anguilla anguilla TaxID=7936 RepID=A0A0E9TAL4_ANGAN
MMKHRMGTCLALS